MASVEQTRRWRERVKHTSEYKRKNLERSKKYQLRIKLECFKHYGSICRCCGETIIEFLTIEHINGNGRKHRKDNKITDIYRWLVLNNYPNGFELLCYNCNCGKRLNKQCPHEKYA